MERTANILTNVPLITVDVMQWLHVQIRIPDENVALVQLVMLEMESIVRSNLCVIPIMAVALQWQHVQKAIGVMLLVNVVQDTLVMV